MASLMKRRGVWTARIYVEGRERWRSLGTGDRQEAERRARDIEQSLKGDRWVRRQLDDLLDRARREVRAEEAPVLCTNIAAVLRELLSLVPSGQRDGLALSLSRSLVEVQQRKLPILQGWGAWLNSANRSSPKDRTVQGYRGIWDRFAIWAERRSLVWFHELDEAGALAYADHLWREQITPRTFTAHVAFLRSVWSTLRVAAGLAQANPWGCVKAKASPAGTGRRDMTAEELRTVIETASGSMRLLLLAGALTGARLGDIASMRWDDLDLDVGEWTFTPMKTSRTGKQLTIPLLSPLLDGLRAARKDATGAHVLPRELEIWKYGGLPKRVSQHFEACGIVTVEALTAGQHRRRARVVVGFHSLRHTAASVAAKSGANLALVQKTLGHSTAGMTAHYTHVDTESARRVLEPLARIVGSTGPLPGEPAGAG